MINILQGIKSYALITLGMIIYVLGWVFFLIPNEIVGGGASGIGAMLYYTTGFPMGYTFFIVNAILMAMAIKILGKDFAIKTIYAIIVVTIAFEVVPRIVEMIPNAMDFAKELKEQNGTMVCVIIGGMFTGTGIAITFAQGGSSGGTDIVAILINKYRNVTPGRILLYIDLIIIASSYFIVSHDFIKTMYGYVLIAVSSGTLDFLLSGSKQSVQMFIFSKKYDELANRITTDLHRGVSIMSATGWFTKEEHKVLMVVVRKYQSNEVYRLIKEVDKDAFITVASVMSVFGQGFDQIKARKRRQQRHGNSETMVEK